MNWNAIGAIGEFVGALAVVASLAYLAVQIRQNTRWLRSSALEAAGSRSAENARLFASDPKLSRIVRFGLSDASELDDDERYQFSLLLMSVLRYSEISYFQHRDGLLPEPLYQGFRDNLAMWTNSELFERWWTRSRPLFNEEFRSLIDNLTSESQPLENTSNG